VKKLFVFLVLIFSLFSSIFAEDLYISKLITDGQGRVLEGTNYNEMHPLASVTKLMSTLVVMDKVEKGFINYDDMVSISRTAAYMRGSYINFHIGEKLSVDDLLKAVIVYSGNDAVYALAEYVSGTEDLFVEEMNKKAQELGMNNTKFYTSTGLPPNMTKKPKDHVDVSTAYDIAILSAEVLKYEKYFEYSDKPYISLPKREVQYKNRNNLLGVFEGVDGLKTGHHSLANYNITVSCLKDNMRLIIVLFGAPNERLRDEEVKRTLNYAYANYKRIKIGEKGEFALKVSIKNAVEREVDLFYNSDLYVTLHKDASFDKVASVPPALNAPLAFGEKVGSLSVKYDNEVIAETSLITKSPIEAMSWFRKALRTITFNLF